MPPKLPKKFDGEGNPSEPALTTSETVEPQKVVAVVSHQSRVTITPEERDVLKKLLDRDRTSREAHGGLKSLLSLSDADVKTLLDFLGRI